MSSSSDFTKDLDLKISPRYTDEEIFEVNDQAQHLFERWLQSSKGEEARLHLQGERALPADFIKSEGIGYCGEGKRSFMVWAEKNGISFELLFEAGLVKRSVFEVKKAFRAARKREAKDSVELTRFFEEEIRDKPGSAQYYHNFPSVKSPDGKFLYGRWLTIPIRKQDEAGKVRIAGFQFRSLRPSEEIGKQGRYRSPRRTQVLEWNETMIGLAEEAEQIRRSKKAVICEGKFDQLAIKLAIQEMDEASRPGVIALGGIAARGGAGSSTPEEKAGVLAVLKELGCSHATLWLDEDERGTEAILGGGEDGLDREYQNLGVGPRIAALGIHVSVARLADAAQGGNAIPLLPEGEEPKDAGELLLAGGREPLLQVLENSRQRGLVSFASAQMEDLLNSLEMGGQVWQRLRALDRIVPVLQCMPAAVLPAAARRVAQVTSVPVEAVQGSLVPSQAPPSTPRRSSRSR